jgi:hypothetical protein
MALKVVRYLGISHTIQRQANNGGFAEVYVYIGPPAAETRSIKFFFCICICFSSSINLYIFFYFSVHKYGFPKQNI